MNHTIDLKPQQDAIRSRYPAPSQEDEALAAVAKLWGCHVGEHVNHRGEFLDYQTEAVAIGRMVKGEMHLAETPEGLWAISVSYSHRFGGAIAAPSVWNQVAYSSRDAAYKAGVDQLIEEFSDIAKDALYARRELRRMIVLLDLTRYPQLSLF